MSNQDETYIHLPTVPHTHTIILLHGRSSTASTFHSELFESQDSTGAFFPDLCPSVKWLFPCAPLRYSDLEQESTNQWFDMASVQRPWEGVEMQEKGLEESARRLEMMILEEVMEVGAEKVIVGGISQGCAMGIYMVLTRGVRLGGFVGLSGWWPNLQHGVVDKELRDMPVLLQHCRDDSVVPVKNGEYLKGRLRKMGWKVEWKCFEDGGHWLNEPEGMDGVVRFIKDVMERSESA
jgi:lysophospholipase-2